MAAGRPTKYKKEYCELLVEHMSKGRSVESFGALIDVGKNTIYQWLKEHHDFQDAMDRGVAKSKQHWELLGEEGIWNEWNSLGGRTFNTQVWAMNMRNRFKWDKEDADAPPESKSKGKFSFTKKKPDSDES